MSAVAAGSQPSKARLDHFRNLRAKLDPSGDPAKAMITGYVESPRAVSVRLAAELALSPSSSHLLIGGVGSGKTTELLATARLLNALDDVRALYIDVSKRHDIAKMVPGAIAVQVGLALAEAIPGAHATQPAKHLDAIAHGYWEEHDYPDFDGDGYHVPGLLVAPEQVEEKVQSAMQPVLALLAGTESSPRQLVVLLDGLDRIADVQAFDQVVKHDVIALGRAGIGLVLVGPLRALYGLERTVTQRFNAFHYQPWIDITQGPEGEAFLVDVLAKRVPGGEIHGSGIGSLVRASGGVLRDLLGLAQAACVEAYMSGAAAISTSEVDAAVDSFGRTQMQGLRQTELEVLQRVRTKGTFVQTSEEDLALLMTRRVLEYRHQGQPRYAVHPTIERFLADLGS